MVPFFLLRPTDSLHVFFIPDRINSKRSDIAPMKTYDCFNPEVPRPRYFWRDNGELCRIVCKCSVFWSYLVFAEVVADNKRWYLANK